MPIRMESSRNRAKETSAYVWKHYGVSKNVVKILEFPCLVCGITVAAEKLHTHFWESVVSTMEIN